jgi:hypothetical protein
MLTTQGVKKLESEIADTVAGIGRRSQEEVDVVRNGLEVFHRVQRERDAQVAQVAQLERDLAVAINDNERLRSELTRYKRKAEHFERANTAVNTRLSVLFESLREVVAVSNAHSYGDRPSTAKKLADIDTRDVPVFLRGVPEKVG